MKSPHAFLFAVLLAGSGLVLADDFSDASKMLEQKKYPEALQLLNKLSAAGHAEAKLRLGEMYWYGEGAPLDRAKGDALFSQAAAMGNAEAAAATKLSAQRASQTDAIAYWSNRYDGADLRSGQYACAMPAIPAVSKNNTQIKATTEALDAYTACHNGFVDHVAAAMPAGKSIPADVQLVMSEQELQAAKGRIETAVARALAAGKADADRVLAQRTAWNTATNEYVAQTNADIAARNKTAAIKRETEDRMRTGNYGVADMTRATGK
jgi:hypothetical protein